MRRLVEWDRTALKDMARLDKNTRDKIRAAVYRYAETDRGDVLKLKGQENQYRLRVGDYRVIFAFQDGKLVILVLRVVDRKGAD